MMLDGVTVHLFWSPPVAMAGEIFTGSFTLKSYCLKQSGTWPSSIEKEM